MYLCKYWEPTHFEVTVPSKPLMLKSRMVNMLTLKGLTKIQSKALKKAYNIIKHTGSLFFFWKAEAAHRWWTHEATQTDRKVAAEMDLEVTLAHSWKYVWEFMCSCFNFLVCVKIIGKNVNSPLKAPIEFRSYKDYYIFFDTGKHWSHVSYS